MAFGQLKAGGSGNGWLAGCVIALYHIFYGINVCLLVYLQLRMRCRSSDDHVLPGS